MRSMHCEIQLWLTPPDVFGFMVEGCSPARQAASLSLSSAFESFFDRRSNVEQAPILAVAADQHQPGGEAILPRQGQRDRAKIEEVDGVGVAQEHRVLPAKSLRLRNLGDLRRDDRRRRQ